MSNEDKIGVGIGVLLANEKGQFLLMKRNSKHATGTYAMPGGWLEFGEGFEQTAARELKEELGVEVGDVEVLGATNNLFPKEN
ncbi:MAG: NUDIX domain-containing protein, partial [Lactobacillus sp.]|nr:NUDIX domain-containing protein [Lactobacillus sp.]